MANVLTPAQLTLLLIDDESSARTLMRQALSGYGVQQVTEASNAPDALQTLRERAFHVVLCDLEMTPVNGLELVHQLRADRRLVDAQTPIILMGGTGDRQIQLEAQEAGVERYLMKPVSAADVMAAVESVLASKRALRLDTRTPAQRRAAAVGDMERKAKAQAGQQPSQSQAAPAGAFREAKALVAESDSRLRGLLATALRRIGFGEVLEVDRVLDVQAAMVQGMVDCVLMPDELTDGSTLELTYKMRHHELGNNPFMVVITMLNQPSQDLVRRCIDTGTDDILLKPFEVNKLTTRLYNLARQRKDFVVTTDYIGPDRRTRDRPSTQKVQQIPVPNPLRADGGGQLLAGNLQEEIDRVARVINEQKMERHAFQVSYLVDKVLNFEEEGLLKSDVVRLLSRLVYVSEDISRRLQGSRYQHASELCLALVDVAKRVEKSWPGTSLKDKELMAQVSQAILGAFRLAEGTAGTAREIVRSLQERNAGQ